MKILFVLEYYPPYTGGSEVLFGYVSKGLADNGHKVRVITSRYDKKLPKYESSGNIEIIRLNFQNRYLFTFFSLPYILKYGRGFDLIHTTTYNASLPAFLAARILRKIIYITFHEVIGKNWFKFPWINKLSAWGFYLYEKLILKLKFDKYIAVSEFTQSSLISEGINQNRIINIYNGVDYKELKKYSHSPSSDSFTYGYFGRLGHSKGLDILIDAAKEFYKAFPDSQLLLIIPKTPKSFYKRIIRLIEERGLGNHVRIMSDLSKDELYKTISKLNCVVIPSYSEGFCFAAVEAIGIGIPVIASKNGALKEVISGKHIFMKDFNKSNLIGCLENAYNNDYSIVPVNLFSLDKSITDYLNLISN